MKAKWNTKLKSFKIEKFPEVAPSLIPGRLKRLSVNKRSYLHTNQPFNLCLYGCLKSITFECYSLVISLFNFFKRSICIKSFLIFQISYIYWIKSSWKVLCSWKYVPIYYSQEKCVRHAQKCVRQARLVALQLHYLPAGNQLLHLSDEEADDVICQHPKFLEVFFFY